MLHRLALDQKQVIEKHEKLQQERAQQRCCSRRCIEQYEESLKELEKKHHEQVAATKACHEAQIEALESRIQNLRAELEDQHRIQERLNFQDKRMETVKLRCADLEEQKSLLSEDVAWLQDQLQTEKNLHKHLKEANARVERYKEDHRAMVCICWCLSSFVIGRISLFMIWML